MTPEPGHTEKRVSVEPFLASPSASRCLADNLRSLPDGAFQRSLAVHAPNPDILIDLLLLLAASRRATLHQIILEQLLTGNPSEQKIVECTERLLANGLVDPLVYLLPRIVGRVSDRELLVAILTQTRRLAYTNIINATLCKSHSDLVLLLKRLKEMMVRLFDNVPPLASSP